MTMFINPDADLPTKLEQLERIITESERIPNQWVYFRVGPVRWRMGFDPKGLTESRPGMAPIVHGRWQFIKDNGEVRETGFGTWILPEFKNQKHLRDLDALKRLGIYDGPIDAVKV